MEERMEWEYFNAQESNLQSECLCLVPRQNFFVMPLPFLKLLFHCLSYFVSVAVVLVP